MADNEFYDPPQQAASKAAEAAQQPEPTQDSEDSPSPGYDTARYGDTPVSSAGVPGQTLPQYQYGNTGGYGSPAGPVPPAAGSYGQPPTGSYGQATTASYGQYGQYGGYGQYGDPAHQTAFGAPGNPAGAPVDSAPAGKRAKAGPLLATALVAALVGGGVGAGTVAIADHNSRSVNTGLQVTNETNAPVAKTDGSIGAAASKIRPSVVTIDVSNGQSGGTGSGVIIRQDGYILTNDHVVSEAANGGSINVTLSDGRTSKGTIVGRDSADDLAVIKVDGLSGLPTATFGKSSSLTVGQTVVAVGAPLGLSDTVTSGIVSNIARPVRSGTNDQAVFQAVQTDAAINPGNSGGPLVDLNGSVVGINAAIATDSSGGGLQIPGQTQQSGNIGIGFAIPSDEASRIASELIASGKAYHAVLGVSVKSTSSTTTAGVALSAVTAGGAGATAGLKVGDVVTAVDTTRVTTADALIAAVRSHAPGQQVKITYIRGGTTATTTVTLGKSDT
ncbi:MAG: putative serine protease PepD [Pseudonocardiales bacterium]|nr:putative serine protease PepD [Pseudonocardiales bacterium]